MDQNSFISGSYHQNDYTKEQNSQFTREFSAITEKMATFLDQGLAAGSEQMQQAVQEHYNFCLKFWKPTREAYKSLAMSYVLPTDYRDSYESVREGLGKYIYDAVIEFADQNLS